MDNDLHIQLQSSVGDFDESFLLALYDVEAMMIEKGLDPSAFIIAKNRAQFPVPYTLVDGMNSYQNDYTVFTSGESFTVTKPNDLAFLEFFATCCFANQNDTEQPHQSLMERLKTWLNGTPDFIHDGAGKNI